MSGEVEVIEDEGFEAEFASAADKKEGTETATINADAGTGDKPVDNDGLEEAAPGDDGVTLSAEEQAAADEAIQAEANKFEGWPQSAIDAYKAQENKTNDLEHRIKAIMVA